jgi:hypothetical protein
MAATPITQPTRKGSAARPRFGDSKIKIVTVKGTELSATAKAIGSSAPSPSHIPPDHPLWPEASTLPDWLAPVRFIEEGAWTSSARLHSKAEQTIRSKIDS